MEFPSQPGASRVDPNALRATANDMHYFHNISLLQPETIHSTARQLADELMALAGAGRYREAAVRFSRAVPITPAANLPDEHWMPVVHYNLGIAYALAEDHENARKHIELSGLPLGGHHPNYLYADRMAIACLNLEAQESVAATGMPSVFITSLPKSASSFVSATLARLMSAPLVTVSLEGSLRPLSGLVIERWARQVARGGAVTHEHYSAQFGNLECLARAGVRKIFVQVRDPRAAQWSFFRQREARRDVVPNPGLIKMSEGRYEQSVHWIQSWLDAQADPAAPEIEFVHYENVRVDPAATIARILSQVGSPITEQQTRVHLDAAAATGRRPDNFRSGDPDEWRRFMPADLKDWLWQKTSPQVRDLVRMQP